MDVVMTAKDIARAGELLDQLARRTADQVSSKPCTHLVATYIALVQCPDEHCQKDLQAYLDSTRLYCHQLKMASAVKSADLSASKEETVRNVNMCVDAVILVCRCV